MHHTDAPAARTATTMAVGKHTGNVFGTGKNVPLIAMAHHIPFVATASVANLFAVPALWLLLAALAIARWLEASSARAWAGWLTALRPA